MKSSHLAHGIAFADDDAIQVQLGLQTAVFAAQGLQGQNVFQGDGCDSGDRGEKVDVVVFKSLFRAGSDQVQNSYGRVSTAISGMHRTLSALA